MKLNVIFLDIDGVLNHHLYYENNHKKSDLSKEENHLDPSKIELINKLCKQANCKVVISSTWRIGEEVKTLQNMLNSRGATFEVIDKTGRCCSDVRGVEVYNWWSKNEDDYNNYVIFDDDNDFLIEQINNFFQIDGYCGITPTIIYKAERFLNGNKGGQ